MEHTENKVIIAFVVVILLFAGTVWLYCVAKSSKAPQLPDKVMAWAFGEDWNGTELRDFPDRWNERHSDIFTIYGTHSIEETNIKLQKSWKEKDGG